MTTELPIGEPFGTLRLKVLGLSGCKQPAPCVLYQLEVTLLGSRPLIVEESIARAAPGFAIEEGPLVEGTDDPLGLPPFGFTRPFGWPLPPDALVDIYVPDEPQVLDVPVPVLGSRYRPERTDWRDLVWGLRVAFRVRSTERHPAGRIVAMGGSWTPAHQLCDVTGLVYDVVRGNTVRRILQQLAGVEGE